MARSQRYYFKDGASFNITGDGTFQTDEMSAGYEAAIVAIAAYDSDEIPVTPSVGTAQINVSPIDGQYHSGTTSGSATIDLTTIGDAATYELPLFTGPMVGAKLTIADSDFATDGIAYIKAFVWRS